MATRPDEPPLVTAVVVVVVTAFGVSGDICNIIAIQSIAGIILSIVYPRIPRAYIILCSVDKYLYVLQCAYTVFHWMASSISGSEGAE